MTIPKLDQEPALQGESAAVLRWARRVVAAINALIDVLLGGQVGGDISAGWTAAAVTIGSTGGALGGGATGALRYKLIGKTVWFSLIVTIPNIGTASGFITVSGLPFSTYSAVSVIGRENAVNGLWAALTLGGTGGFISSSSNGLPTLAAGVTFVFNTVAEVS